jgi:hypothetical protein
MDIVQNCDSCIYILLSQTYRYNFTYFPNAIFAMLCPLITNRDLLLTELSDSWDSLLHRVTNLLLTDVPISAGSCYYMR